MIRRSSAIAARPACATSWSAARVRSGSARVMRAAPACTTITLTAWATTSCSSLATRLRSPSAASARRISSSARSRAVAAASLWARLRWRATSKPGQGRNDSYGKCVFDHVRDAQRTGNGGENGAHHDPVDHEGSQLSDLAAGEAPRPGRVHGQQYRQPHHQVVVLQRTSAGEPLAADCAGTGDYHGGFGSPAAPCHRRRSGQRADHARGGQAGGRGAGYPQAEDHGGQSPGNNAVDERRPATPGSQGQLRDLSCSAHPASVRRLTRLDVLQKNDILVVAEATGGSLFRPATAGTPAAHADSMTANRFRAAAWALISFNILGTILTWAAHLQKPGTGAANAIAGGTQVTGPLLLVAVAIVAVVLTYSTRRWLARTGIVLLALFGAGFAFGEITELFQHNIGISAGRWDVVIAASVIGAIIGITEAFLAVKALLTSRQADRLAATTTT